MGSRLDAEAIRVAARSALVGAPAQDRARAQLILAALTSDIPLRVIETTTRRLQLGRRGQKRPFHVEERLRASDALLVETGTAKGRIKPPSKVKRVAQACVAASVAIGLGGSAADIERTFSTVMRDLFEESEEGFDVHKIGPLVRSGRRSWRKIASAAGFDGSLESLRVEVAKIRKQLQP